MDQQLAEWQRQAQEAIQQQPEKKDAIMAMYNDDIRKYLEDQKRMAQKAIDEQGKPDYVISQFKQMLEDNKDVISFNKDLDYSKMFDVRPMQFRDTRSGVSSTADLPYEQGKFEGETPEEYYDRLERQSGGGTGPFSPFRLEEEEKAAAAQEEARRKAREALSFTGKLAADAEGFGKSLLSGGFKAGSAAAGIAGGVTEALGSTMNPVGSALGYNPLQEGADFLFKKSQEGKQASQMLQESIPMEASNTSRVLGQIVPQMAGGFVVEPFALGSDVLDSGGSLTEAQLMSAKQGAINVAGLASGMLGSQARGILPLLSRGAAQVPTNIALGAADRKLSGQEYTNEDMAMDAAFGAFGSIFRNADTPRVPDVLEDGPPAKAGEIDFSGDKGRIGESAEFSIPIQAIDRNKGMAPVDLTEQVLKKYPSTVDAKEPPVFGEIVPTKTVIEDTGTASAREVDRISLMEREANALPSREAEALAKENIANSKKAHTRQKELDQIPTEQELYSKLAGEYFAEDGKTHGPDGANNPRLTKLRPEASFPSQGEGVSVAVSRPVPVGVHTQVPAEPWSAKFSYTIDNNGTLTQVASGKSRGRGKATKITKEPGTPAPQSIAQLEQRLVANNQPPLLSSLGEGKEVHVVGAPRHLLDKLDKGTLTVDDVLTEGQKAVDSDPRGKKEGAHIIKYLSRLADSIGGRGVKFAVLDNNNPKHLEALQASEDIKNGRFSAFYHPQTNTIYLKPSTRGFNTMVHEATHGIVSKLLDMGKNGELKPAAQEAYNNLNTMFGAIKPELESRLAGLPEGSDLREAKGYGLTNVHEMYSEFFASKVFRDFLKELKIEKTWVDSLPENIRGVFVHAKNMYEVLKKGLSRFLASTGIRSHLDLGAGAKAENAYDYLLSSMEELHNSLEAGQSRMLRELSERNTDKAAPDLSFLGEQVETRAGAYPSREDGTTTPAQENLRPQRSRLTASLKSGIAGRGLEPILTNARETLSGDKQEARLRQVTLVNKSIGALEGMGEATKSRVFELLGELESDSASPKSREQFAELKTLSPEIAATAKELLNDRFTNSGVLSNLLLESMKKSGKFDQKTANIALKIMENSNSWKPSVYDSKEATLRRRKSALRAEKKQQEKKLLSDEEKDDLAKWQNLNTWIRNTTYGNAEQLKKLSTDDLRAIYEANIKDAPSLKGLDKDAQRDLMIGYISDYNSKIVDIDQAVRNLADSIAGFGGSRDPLIKYFNGLKYDSGVLATKEQVPKVIREFWGEITNPLLRLIEGHTKQLLQISQVKALNSLRESGLGTLFTDRVDTHMNTRMQGSNYGALEGLYTTPEIHQAMGDIMDFGRQATGVMDSLLSGRDLTNTSLAGMEKVLWAWVNATRAVKTSTTVLNAGAWWRNLEGSALQVVSNGNINPASYAKGMEAMTGLVGITQKSSVNPLSAKMIKLGLGEASQIADTYSAKNTRALDVLKTILDEHPEASPGKVRKLLDAGGHTKDVVKELYGALDLWTKFANFFNDLEQVREFNKRNDIEMSEQQLERYVADRTKQTNITYSRSPKVLKVLESLGNTQFANYYYEVFRTSLNNIGLGIQDTLKGIKYGDAAYTAHGLKRLVGTATAITAGTAIYTAITKATMAALGLAATEEADKKEIEEYRKESGFQDPTTSLEFKDPSTGGIFSFDAASINPYDPMAKVVLPALRAIADPANADEYGAEIAKNMGNLINRTPLIGGVTKALSGKSPSLKNTSPAAYDALVDMGVNGLGISVDTMDRVINATNALMPKQIKEVARAVSTEGSLSTKLAIGSGAGVYEVSPEKDVTNFLGPAFQAQLREAKEDYKDLMTSRIPVTKGALDKRFLQAIKDIAKPYASLDKAVKAQVALGRSKEDIIRAMMGKNIEKSVAQMLYEGKATPALIVYDNMLDTAKAEIKQLDNRPKERQAAEDRWQKKLSAIEEIATKYSKYSFEEIEEL